MHITTYTDYALRVLMYIGLRPDMRPTILEIADSFGISKNHLVKCVHHLGKSGFLKNTRGKSGGLELAMAPEMISLGKVVREMEPDMNIVPCMKRENRECVITDVCSLRSIFFEARENFLHTLDGYSLSDLVRNRTSLLNALKPTPASGTAAIEAAH